MADRIQLLQDVVMTVDSQYSIVRAGSVIDVPDARKFHSSHATVLSEAPAPVTKNGVIVNSAVRTFKTK